ncbi:MAG: DUF402 domain-containing protein [Anaerolinea sp.]|nr:DUF402 domain-containing protein [Anaerolinea sp.]
MTVTVQKRDHTGRVVWTYDGAPVERGADYILLEAYFNRDDRDDGYFVWQRDDRFLEWYYADRWYNVFKIFDRETGAVRGWYCNLTRPAEIEDALVYADDLELDVFVYPSREVVLKDEEAFAALDIPADERRIVWETVAAIKTLVAAQSPPFD